MANSQQIFGCCNVFSLAKGLIIIDIGLVIGMIWSFIRGRADYSILALLIQIAYLIAEYVGIDLKNKCLIIFGCVIRVLEAIG